MTSGMDEREVVATDVDELWLREWAQSGLVALEAYLAKHAAFADFLRLRPHLESDDDGSARSV